MMVAVRAGVIEPYYEVVAIDELTMVTVEKDSAVSNYGAGGVSKAGVRAPVVAVKGAFDQFDEIRHDFRLEAPVLPPITQRLAELWKDLVLTRETDADRDPTIQPSMNPRIEVAILSPPKG